MTIIATVPYAPVLPVDATVTINGVEYPIPADQIDGMFVDGPVYRITAAVAAAGYRRTSIIRYVGDLAEFDVEPIEGDA
ncbi:hypothetical protein [Catenuloplanes indicus]|uniref:Uncharacterized protein n=1 Tax=Catenuloplanes indicus TaxID=137267 RepID=A0AAE3VUA5_9ACTN|nr:hypothetical protein [Catenuloplanes indicus]MDQ0363412.1 hypothetical protein [Catenuloplanes indicus]